MAPAPPLRSRGALLTMARLFGDWKNPNPKPETMIRQMMSASPGWAVAEVDGLGDPAVLALSDRITGVAHQGRAKGSLGITVMKTDGRSITVEATDPIGSPDKPLSDAQFEAKFRDCARNAVRPLSDASVDAALAAINRLETLPDARELMAICRVTG
jgi:2-methylcitrate dehydratase PrpD